MQPVWHRIGDRAGFPQAAPLVGRAGALLLPRLQPEAAGAGVSARAVAAAAGAAAGAGAALAGPGQRSGLADAAPVRPVGPDRAVGVRPRAGPRPGGQAVGAARVRRAGGGGAHAVPGPPLGRALGAESPAAGRADPDQRSTRAAVPAAGVPGHPGRAGQPRAAAGAVCRAGPGPAAAANPGPGASGIGARRRRSGGEAARPGLRTRQPGPAVLLAGRFFAPGAGLRQPGPAGCQPVPGEGVHAPGHVGQRWAAPAQAALRRAG